MKKAATLSSKNQVTIPAEVRKALGLSSGQVVVFEVDNVGPSVNVTLRRHPTLEELSGSISVPPDVAGLSWSEIRSRAWTQPGNTDTIEQG
ncbi:MAG: AbrB/MazE/SpoVT family DNA-binding domain-containing protein [Chloroflexota bacterium]